MLYMAFNNSGSFSWVPVTITASVKVTIKRKKKIVNRTYEAEGTCCEEVFGGIQPPEDGSLIENCCKVKKTCFERTETPFFVLEAGDTKYKINRPANASQCLLNHMQNMGENPQEYIVEPLPEATDPDDDPDWIDGVLSSIEQSLLANENWDPVVTQGPCEDPNNSNGYYTGSQGILPEPSNCTWGGYSLLSDTESEEEVSSNTYTYGPYNLGEWSLESPCSQNYTN